MSPTYGELILCGYCLLVLFTFLVVGMLTTNQKAKYGGQLICKEAAFFGCISINTHNFKRRVSTLPEAT